MSAKEGDAYPLGALPVGTLVNNVEIQPGKGSEYIRAAGSLFLKLGIHWLPGQVKCFFFLRLIFSPCEGTSGVLLRKVNGTAIVQLPSKQQVQVRLSGLGLCMKGYSALYWNAVYPHTRTQVLETCMVTVGRVSNIDHDKEIIGKAGRNRWLGIRPSSGLWQRKGGWAGRKIKPLPPMKSYVNLPSISAKWCKSGRVWDCAHPPWIRKKKRKIKMSCLYRRLKMYFLLSTTACESMERNKTI